MQLLQLRSILVATDLRPGSRAAEHTAVKLAMATQATLHVVHVVPDEPSDMTREERLDRLQRIGGPGTRTHADLLDGDIVKAVLEAQAAANADAVVLGPRRDGAPNPGPLGSVAYALVGRASVPILIAPHELLLPLTRVIVAVDRMEGSTAALAAALTWAGALRHPHNTGLRSTLVALHVEVRDSAQRLCGADVERLRAMVEGECRRVASWSGLEMHFECAEGKGTAETILERQATADADLLVIGTRAERPNVNDPLGSVSDTVTRWATRPVLLVPPHARPPAKPTRTDRRSRLRA